jgi:hypothetical protein
MISSFNSGSPDGSKYSLSEKEIELGFIVAEVEDFSISDPDYYEKSTFLKLSDSDALFKEVREGKVYYSHRRWGSKPNQGWSQWSPVQNPISNIKDAIALADPNMECPLYSIERQAFKVKQLED